MGSGRQCAQCEGAIKIQYRKYVPLFQHKPRIALCKIGGEGMGLVEVTSLLIFKEVRVWRCLFWEMLISLWNPSSLQDDWRGKKDSIPVILDLVGKLPPWWPYPLNFWTAEQNDFSLNKSILLLFHSRCGWIVCNPKMWLKWITA